jgi:phosphomannomutase
MAKLEYMKKLLIFDLDGTLAESKSAIDAEMTALLTHALEVMKVAIISGGDMPQFKKQVVAHLPPDKALRNLSLLPTCGTRFFRYVDDWENLYAENLSSEQKTRINKALSEVFAQSGLTVERTWGAQIEDRESQITFSALGQEAPLDAKKTWDPDFSKRKKMQLVLEKQLPDFAIRLGGSTSIDVTLPGIDKAYGVHKLVEILDISIDEMLFVGDALFPGGNDEPARRTGVDCIQVAQPEETKRIIEAVIACVRVR